MYNAIEHVLSIIINIINMLGYWGIAGGMLLESACIPLPSEVVLPLAGNMVANGTINMIGANIAVAIGSMIGSITAYTVGFYGGRPFILKYGKYFFMSEKSFLQADKTFVKYGSAAVFFGRLLPVIRTFISLPAGIARMSFKKFITYSLIGMIPWNFMLIWLGYKFGQQYESVIRPYFKKFEYLVLALIVLAVVIFVYKHFFGKNKYLAD